jgi:nitronate monooxygenase
VGIPANFAGRLSLPVIAAPLFIISNPDLTIAQCKAGVIGSFPALNASPGSVLDEWLARIQEELGAHVAGHPRQPSAPFAVNQIVHRTNKRLERDLELCVKYRVPLVITSLGAREDVNQAIHSYGGIVLHDVINDRFAHKAIEKGADGLIAVAAGAGGHAGMLSPFAFVRQLRTWWDGPIALSGAIATGENILAAQVIGADFAYIGSAFIATEEANAHADYKRMIVDGDADDIVYTNLFTGVHGNYLRPSVIRSGLDPDNLPVSDPSTMNFGESLEGSNVKPWRDIWGSGQGIGAVAAVVPTAELVARFRAEYDEATAHAAALSSLYAAKPPALFRSDSTTAAWQRGGSPDSVRR